MDDFLQRLKQRKLVQWALAYVAFAFALIQVLDVVADSYGWPRTAMHIVFGLLVLGFVVTVILAWYHGERGAQRISGPELLLIALALVIGGGLLWHFARVPATNTAAKTIASVRSPDATQHNPGLTSSTAAARAPAPVVSTSASAANAALLIAAQPIPAKSVAVLPFENLSTDKGNAYFADGMQDLILTKLADIGDLKVISRTSTLQYGSHPENLTLVGKQLGVATILEGSVQKAGNQVLINVQLIDAKTDSHIWAQSYQRTLDNIFGVEGEVAEKVAKALNAKLSPTEAQAIANVPTHNKAALDAYLKAVYYLDDSNRTLDKRELERAATLAAQATRLDPDFSDAWDLLALAYVKYADYGDHSHMPQAEAAARRALVLDPNDARAHMSLAFVLGFNGHTAAAVAHAREAARLRPSDPAVVEGLGIVYANTGDPTDGAVALQRAIQLAPKGYGSRGLLDTNLADAYMMLRRYVDARDILQGAAVHDPADVLVATALAQAWQLGWGDLAAARKVLRGVPAPVASSGTLSAAWYWQDMYARDYAAALDVIAKAPAAWFQQQGNPLALYQARAYRAQGDDKRARQAFAQARAALETGVKDAPNNAALHANLSMALAGLGDGKAAAAEAQRAVKLGGVESVNQQLLNLAEVEAWVGETNASMKLLDQLLGKPAGDVISTSLLKLSPAWDPIRHDPRFKSLLKKYGNAQPATGASGAKQ